MITSIKRLPNSVQERFNKKLLSDRVPNVLRGDTLRRQRYDIVIEDDGIIRIENNPANYHKCYTDNLCTPQILNDDYKVNIKTIPKEPDWSLN